MDPASLQPPAIVFRSPTITVSTICAALERSADDVLRLIWDGSLRFAWNIARDGQTRQEIRVLAQSLFEYQHRLPAPKISNDADFQNAIRTIFPATSQKPNGVKVVRAATIARRLCASRPHIGRLCGDKVFRIFPGSSCHGGPTGSPEVEFSSVAEFLKQRRIA